MELFDYIPGGLAAAWMVFRMAILWRDGAQAEAPSVRLKPSLRLV